MSAHTRRTPTERFRLQLAAAILLFSLLISGVVSFFLYRNAIHDTADLTTKAVQNHFTALFSGMLHEQGHSGSHDRNTKMVRMHFDIYQIAFARFLGPDGTITFSYDAGEIGKPLPLGLVSTYQELMADGDVVPVREGNNLSVWVPIRDQATGHIHGTVHIVRDISAEWQAIRNIMIVTMISLVIGAVLLYLLLRHNYDKSTDEIARQERLVRRMLHEIESTYDASLQALSSALDTRDNETNGHSFRVTAYTLRLARELGVGEERLPVIMRGALLHDVGKIGVPDAILRKPGPLTADEWQIMREHVEIGYQMLKHIPFLHDALEIVRHHHERWDGEGYPDRLAGPDIPLSARIFALCDTYDAITSDRPYRRGRSYEEAREEIIRCSGGQFDPEVVEAFLRIPRDEWLAVGQLASTVRHESRPLDKLFRTAALTESGSQAG